MASFKEVKDLLLLEHSNGLISDDELLFFMGEYQSKNPEFTYDIYERFNLDDMEEPECKAYFRFEKNDIPVLAETLGLPDFFKCTQRTVAGKIEGLCLVLRRMAYPCRLGDLIPVFGRPVPELSMIANCVLEEIYDLHAHRVSQWNREILSPVQLESYAEAVHRKGAALDNCFGFVDGTVRPISRPVESQEVVYNGHKRVHALKFQSVTLPNGLIGNMFGPIEGRRHDASMLGESGLLQDLEREAFSTGGQPMCIYGDPAYPMRVHLQAPYRGNGLTPAQQAFNDSMCKVRTSVEWVFGDIVRSFKSMDFKNNLKIGLSQVGKMYIVCSIIRNALTCLYGNNTSQYFDLDPPTLQEYFG